jgi:hypothetical protein
LRSPSSAFLQRTSSNRSLLLRLQGKRRRSVEGFAGRVDRLHHGTEIQS